MVKVARVDGNVTFQFLRTLGVLKWYTKSESIKQKKQGLLKTFENTHLKTHLKTHLEVVLGR